MDNIELFNEFTVVRVSSKTLLKHSKYKGDWRLVLIDGWGYNNRLDKFYKIVRNEEKDICPHCKGTGEYEYETGVEHSGIVEIASVDCFCTFRRPAASSTKPQKISFFQWN